MKRILAVLCCLLMLSGIAPGYAETEALQIYVSPDGSDSGNGSESRPFATIERAQQAVREINKNMQSDIIVNLAAGTYFLENPILMDETDSGRNEYKIIWRGVPGKTVVSGGEKITGWEQHDGDIWKIKLPEEYTGRYISNVYIGDKIATFSRIEDKYFVAEINDETNENGNKIKTATFSSDEIPYDEGMNDVLLFWDYAWRHYMWPVNEVATDKKGDTVLKMIEGAPTYSIDTMYVPPAWNVILANAYAFIDRPGEFYCDRQRGEIFYYKDEGENLNSLETIIPKLEYLWRIEGETTENAVENISFEGITFSHSMCQRNYKYGMYPNQGLEGMQGRCEESIKDVDFRMTNRGAVEVINAKNISFEGNTFTKLDNIGLAMYSGVIGGTVKGNLFSDTADTALSIGEPVKDDYELEKEFGMTDISARKPAYYSEPYNRWFSTIQLLAPESNTAAVDFEGSYSISRIYLKLAQAMNSNDIIEIQASNMKSFAGYEILTRIYPKNSEWQTGENTYTVDIGDPIKYKYVRIINKTGNIFVDEFRVYTDELGGGGRAAICENIDVTDNLMVRTGREFWSSVVIHVFTAKNINISHNEIDGCPYTGISLGWNWAGGQDMPGIKINYNRIKNTMQRSHDGAAIYVLGTHTDSEIKGNYITGCINGMGGIYPDNGSCYWTIEENVIEEVNISLHPWNPDQHDITMKNNYTTAPYYVIGARDSTMEDTELYIRKNMPAHIREKANMAGIREPYAVLREKAGEGSVPYDPILIDGYPAPQCYAPHYFWNAGFSYLHAAISEADNMIKTAKLSNLISGFEEEYAAFEADVLSAKQILNGEFERDLYYTTLRLLKQKIDEFADCGIFTGKEYIQLYQNHNVKGREAKGGNTVVSTKKPVYLDFMVDDYDFLNIGAATSVYRNTEKTQFKMTNSDANVTYFAANKFKDAVFEGKISFESGHPADWQGFVLRATDASNTPGSEKFSCYIVDFMDYGIEVQRFNNGKRTVFFGDNIGGVAPIYQAVLGYGSWQRGNPADVKVGTLNEEDGVRIFLEVNGTEIFNILDDSPDALYDGGFLGFVSPDGTITIEKKADTEEYTDLIGYEWAKSAIYQLSYIGAINGIDKNTFSPDGIITRAQFVKILAEIMNLSGTESSFNDIDSNKWYFSSVAGLEAAGAFDGIFEGSFSPDTPILREEMAAIALKAKGSSGIEITASFKDSGEISENMRDAVLEYASMGLISGMGDGNFAPKETATRAQAAVLLYNLYSTLEV